MISIILFTFCLRSLPLLLAWALDNLLGDPMWLPHPVVGMGRMIGFGEKLLNRGTNRRLKGGVLAVVCIAFVYVATLLLFSAVSRINVLQNAYIPIYAYLVVSVVLIYFCLAGMTLRREVRMTFEAVDRSVEEGRKQVGRIVGRDTTSLTPQEIRTAALETQAENLNDGVIAPLFWYFMLGVPGMMAYKMVNTLDSMIGYKNERYAEFGFVAAKIDDAAGYVPARLTALLMLVAAKIVRLKRYGFRRGLQFVAQFGPQHASPNSGWPEAALASVLDCCFGGPHYYFGEYVYKPYIGTNSRQLTTADMKLSQKVCFLAEALMVMTVLVLNFFVG